MQSAWISWDDKPPVQYDFESPHELNAFMKGLEEGRERPTQTMVRFNTAAGYAETQSKKVHIDDELPVPEWPREMQYAAQKQGWDLFCCDGGEVDDPKLPDSRQYEIEGLAEWPDDVPESAGDPPFFANDSGAVAFVKAGARGGDPVAIRAIEFLVAKNQQDVWKFDLQEALPDGNPYKTIKCGSPGRHEVIRLACNTSGEEGRPQFAMIELTPQIAAELLAYRPVVEQARKFSDRLCCVEFFDSRVTWGDTALNIGDEWVGVIDQNAVSGGDLVCAETVKATSTGVRWSASPKHSNGQFETEELAWSDLGAIAAGNNPFKTLKEEA